MATHEDHGKGCDAFKMSAPRPKDKASLFEPVYGLYNTDTHEGDAPYADPLANWIWVGTTRVNGRCNRRA